MIIETKYHGQVEIQEEKIWTFTQGIPGFAEEKQFILLALPDNDVFFILQSTNTPNLGFVVTSPFAFFPDYEFQLDEVAIDALRLDQAEEAAIYTILTVQDPFEKTTANLQAPIVVNTKNNKAKQTILNDSRYETRHAIFPVGAKKE
ncbi:flagellar assembly protein FliW [Bacillus sp. FJAT-52991]|uniref:Flagellar assembly factor FliW n=1 Tax=Bacillus kandeliae TaxID=3129297 RepID=A0ABZ2N5A1_9BACI